MKDIFKEIKTNIPLKLTEAMEKLKVLLFVFFRHNFEQDVANAKKNYYITTYNCTEGGARIEGTIEKPFLWACEIYLIKI